MRAMTLALCLALAAPVPSAALAQGKAPKAAKETPKEAGKDPEKTAAIRKLLVLTGSGRLGLQVMTQMINSLKTSMPKVPENFWQDFMKEVNPDELIDMVVPIYDRHLSMAEVKDIIRFYETPSGQKLIATMPQITQESMDVGRTWGRELGERVARKLREQEQAQPQRQAAPKKP